MIGATIGSLEIKSEIGRGGMGVVYLAEHLKLRKKFAVKSLSPALTEDKNFRERFFIEARNQAKLSHVNIVQATDFIEENGQFFFVMEYVDGDDLDQLIKNQGTIHENRAITIIKDILGGLQDAHGKGIIHRDIKPSNILIDRSGRARIMDFGIAMMLGGERLTATGSIIGSPWYMSPEQIQNPKTIDGRSDIYSVGIVLYEMLTGNVPFDGETEFSVKSKQVNDAAPDPRQFNSAISTKLAEIILRALEKKPSDRFQECQAFIDELTALRLPGEPEVQPAGSKKIVWLAGAVVIVGFLIALAVNAPWEKKTVEVIKEKKIVTQPDMREPARILVEGALEKAILICNERTKMEIKRKNIKPAQDLGDSALLEKLNRHILEHKQNIEDGVSAYNHFMTKLKGIDRQVVDGVFKAYKQSLINNGAVQKAKSADKVQANYRSFLDNGKPLNLASIDPVCAPN